MEMQTHRNLRGSGSGNLLTRGLELEQCTDDAVRSDSCNSTENEISYVAPTGNNGDINATDGEIGDNEWDLSKCGVPMYEAGDAGKANAIQKSQAWVDWNCATNTLCILIKTLNETEYVIRDEDNSERWFRAYDRTLRNKIDLTSGWTNIVNLDNDITAVEACYSVAEDVDVTCINEAEIHVNMVPAGSPTADGDTSSTGSKNGSGNIALNLVCPLPTSNPSNSPTILSTSKPTKDNDGTTKQPTREPSRSPTQHPSLRPSQSAK